MHLVGGAGGVQRVLLVGVGNGDRSNALRRAASLAARRAHGMGVGKLAFWAGPLSPVELENVAVGLALGPWEYRDLKSPVPEAERRAALTEAVILVDDEGKAKQALANGEALATGYDLARRLAMMPGNLCTPDFLAETAKGIADRHGM